MSQHSGSPDDRPAWWKNHPSFFFKATFSETLPFILPWEWSPYWWPHLFLKLCLHSAMQVKPWPRTTSLFLKPCPSYCHVGEALTEDHIFFFWNLVLHNAMQVKPLSRTTSLFLKPRPSHCHWVKPWLMTTPFFLKPCPSYCHVSEALTKDHTSFSGTLRFILPCEWSPDWWPHLFQHLFFWKLALHIAMQVKPWPMTTPLFLKPCPPYCHADEPQTEDHTSCLMLRVVLEEGFYCV